MDDPGHNLQRVRELFAAAEELPAAERESFVRSAAGADRALADEVLLLLGTGEHTEAMAAKVRTRLAADRPDRIGPYTIVDTLGEGGMGTVYLAEQTTPVKRRVALKLIKLGMDSKAVEARFEQERQALALMDHDGIAKVYDCGTSERGQLFFVMELVQGVPLTRFCDEHRVSLRGRIELMQQVCAAVQHAHQKGVVHRDLSPRNVLVALRDGAPQAKIIDFGLAKSLGPSLGDTSALTEAGQVVGTLAYMAPEQADPSNPDVDTRADVYALGAMLYELLSGEQPFPFAELRRKGMLEVQRVLREVDPPKPSSKLLVPRQQLETLAAARCVSTTTLRKALQQDLDWVVLKAIEKDRARRYPTPEALAADLQRFLDCEPLAAGPPSAAYRIRKVLRRHRGQVLAAAAILVTALAGAVVAANYAVAARDNARLRAENEAKTNAARRAAVTTGWNRLRRPDILVGDIRDLEGARTTSNRSNTPDPVTERAAAQGLLAAYDAVLADNGMTNSRVQVPDLLRTAPSVERELLLDEMYWLELTIHRTSGPSASGTQPDAGEVGRWIRTFERRPLRAAAYDALGQFRAGDPRPLAEVFRRLPTQLPLDDLEWLAFVASSSGADVILNDGDTEDLASPAHGLFVVLTPVREHGKSASACVRHRQLRATLQFIADRDPGRWWVRWRLATMTDGNERLEHAAAAVALGPSRSSSWYNYAWNFQFIDSPPFGDPARAAAAYRRALALDPTNWRAALNLTHLVPEAEGLALMQEASVHTRSPILEERKAERLRTLRRCEDAVEVCRAALVDFPEHAGLHALHGECLGWLSRFAEAIAPLEKCRDLGDRSEAVRQNLIHCLRQAAAGEADPELQQKLQTRANSLALEGTWDDLQRAFRGK